MRMPSALTFAPLVCCLAICLQGKGVAAQNKESKDRRVSFKAENITPLAAILEVAAANEFPMGIVLGARPTLCEKPRSFEIKDRTISDVLALVVEGTGYKVSLENGVLDVTAPDRTEHEELLLNQRFGKFSAFTTTMAGVGGVLAGQLATLDGAKGYALNILSDSQAETIAIPVIENSTTKEIANVIVSAGSKGVWVFRPTPVPHRLSEIKSPIQIYGYANDGGQLAKVACEQ